MKLYFSPGACSQAVHIALVETALPFALEKVDLGSKRTASGGDFRQINPLGYVPVLELDDGTRWTEAGALLQYVADQAPQKNLVPQATGLDHYRLLSMLNFLIGAAQRSRGTVRAGSAGGRAAGCDRACIDPV